MTPDSTHQRNQSDLLRDQIHSSLEKAQVQNERLQTQ